MKELVEVVQGTGLWRFLYMFPFGLYFSICTFEVVEVVPEVDSALLKGILTSSFPGVFSTTRFMATPSVACRIFPLPTNIHKKMITHTKYLRGAQQLPDSSDEF